MSYAKFFIYYLFDDSLIIFLVFCYARKLFGLCSEAEMFVAKGLVHYTIDIEAKVIQPAQVLLEVSMKGFSFDINVGNNVLFLFRY